MTAAPRFLNRLLFLTAGAIAGLYLAVAGLLFLKQRAMLYFPAGHAVLPAAAGLPQAHALTIATTDGERLLAWYIAPQPGRPEIVYFHGNGDNLAGCAERIARLTQTGDGLLAVEYRGYPGSSGKPTETGLLADGEAGYDEALALGVPAKRVVLLGESLGSGVAVALAARHPVGALVLDSPYSSVVDVAETRAPIFPVRWMMLDQFRSDLWIDRVTAPLLIIHGTADQVIPIRFARKLFGLAHQPKTFIVLPGVGHLAMDADTPAVVSWIDRTVGG